MGFFKFCSQKVSCMRNGNNSRRSNSSKDFVDKDTFLSRRKSYKKSRSQKSTFKLI